MNVYYASRTGNVESMINKLGISATKIEGGDEVADEDFILITYTDGYGDIPAEVDAFLANNSSHLKGSSPAETHLMGTLSAELEKLSQRNTAQRIFIISKTTEPMKMSKPS